MAQPTSSGANAANRNFQLPPLRSVDDFLLGSARFQLPNFGDLEQFGNHVVKNLLYYQTNYLGVFIIVYVLMLFLNPAKIFCDLIVKAALAFVLIRYFPDRSMRNRWDYLGGTIVAGCILLMLLDAFLLSVYTFLLPFGFTLIHASLRLRNIQNRGFNILETFAPSTPMGRLLNYMNITVENLFS